MTLIVAMKDDDDSVLLAADSGGMEEGARSRWSWAEFLRRTFESTVTM